MKDPGGGMGNVSAIRQQLGEPIRGSCGVAYREQGSTVLSFSLLLAQVG